MAEKCVCHINGYRVKDTVARNNVTDLFGTVNRIDDRVTQNATDIATLTDKHNKLNDKYLNSLSTYQRKGNLDGYFRKSEAPEANGYYFVVPSTTGTGVTLNFAVIRLYLDLSSIYNNWFEVLEIPVWLDPEKLNTGNAFTTNTHRRIYYNDAEKRIKCSFRNDTNVFTIYPQNADGSTLSGVKVMKVEYNF